LFFEAERLHPTKGKTMTEREIFAAALGQSTEAERRAFLDDVCDADMRRRIEQLLNERLQLWRSALKRDPPGVRNRH